MEKKWKVRIISTVIGVATVLAVTLLNTLVSPEVSEVIKNRLGPTAGVIVMLLLTEVVKYIKNEYSLGKARNKLGGDGEKDVILI